MLLSGTTKTNKMKIVLEINKKWEGDLQTIIESIADNYKDEFASITVEDSAKYIPPEHKSEW